MEVFQNDDITGKLQPYLAGKDVEWVHRIGLRADERRQGSAIEDAAVHRVAEIVRDIALDASGLLNPEVGGPSVHPYAPEFLFLPPASYARKTWIEDHGAERYRRALDASP